MWFLDKKIKQYLKHVEHMRQRLFRMSQHYVQDDAAFHVTDNLFNQFNRLSFQILRDINAFEKVTETMKETLISFLPWSEAYALRCNLTKSLNRYERFCEEVKVASQFLRKATLIPQQQKQIGFQLSLPKSGTEITYESLALYSRTQIAQSNSQLKASAQDESTKDKPTLPEKGTFQKRNAILPPKICPQNNHANYADKNCSLNSFTKLSNKNSPQNLQAKLDSKNQKPILIISGIEAVKTATPVYPERDNSLINQWHSFWQTLFPPIKKQYKTIHEWLGVPVRRF